MSRSGAAMLCCAFFILEASTDSAALDTDDITEVSDRSERSLKMQVSCDY